jgi:hypothetical protein
LCAACGGTVTDPGSFDAQVVEADAAPEATPDAMPARYSSLRRLGHYPLESAADLAVSSDGSFAVVTGWYDGSVYIIDTSDKSAPTLIATIDEQGYSPDVQLMGSTLYVTHENIGQVPFIGVGVSIFDLSDPASPQSVGSLDEASGDPGLENCHNIWPQPERDLLYCASSNTGRVVILSTAAPGSPAQPQVLTTIPPPEGGAVHDMYAKGDRLYVAWLEAGLAIYDIADASAPAQLGRAQYEGALTHTIWPSEDATVVYTTDEIPGGHLRVWDLADVSTPQEVGSYQPNADAVIHNAEVFDEYIVISHYTEGVKVLDAEVPTSPSEIGADDFFDGPDRVKDNPYASMRGAWGVEAVLPYVFVSGTESGLWIYELE